MDNYGIEKLPMNSFDGKLLAISRQLSAKVLLLLTIL
jgi:hypothetical protein